MASPPFEMEDQTDEDFFDKLVNDDIDFTGSMPSFVENNEFDAASAFSNLSISEADSAAAGDIDNVSFGNNSDLSNKNEVASASLDAHVDSVIAKESDLSITSNAKKTSEVGIGAEGALDSTVDKSGVSMETEAKEVQWDSFNSDSDSQLHRGSGYRSYTDLFGNLGDNLEDPFANVGDNHDTEKSEAPTTVNGSLLENPLADSGSFRFGQHGEGQCFGTAEEQNAQGQDLSSSQYWENLYPGWKYDPNTGQWYQLEGYDANANVNGDVNVSANSQESFNMNSQLVDNANVSDQRTDAYYLQKTTQSVAGIVTDGCTTSSVSNWNQVSQGNTEYPAHMVFDPQYPGWYYDTIVQEWKQLDSYNQGVDQSTSVDHNQHHNLNGENHESQGQFNQDLNWGGSINSYNQQNVSMWQNQQVAESETIGFTESQKLGNQYISTDHRSNTMNQQTEFNSSGSIALSEQASQGFTGSTEVAGFPSFNPAVNFAQHYNQTKKEQNQNMHFSPAHFGSQKPVYFSQQPLQSGTSFSYVPSEGRSSAGRPPHAVVTFGFGGKLVVMKDNSYSHANSAYGSQVRPCVHVCVCVVSLYIYVNVHV